MTLIPKVIHYVWLGGRDLPEDAVRCIESWRKYCPDYEIRRWDETSFDLHANKYVEEALHSKKWAFVSDYVRLLALVTCGGIYMDTDVEVLSSLDCFLDHQAFSGFESNNTVPTGIMGCEAGFPLFRDLLNQYESRRFILPDGSFDMTTNVVAITNECVRRGLVSNNSFQVVDGFALYPSDWFCPKSHETGVITLTSNSHTIHHFAGSWLDDVEQGFQEQRFQLLEKHPWLPPVLISIYLRCKYGFQTGDFSYLTSKIRVFWKMLARK